MPEGHTIHRIARDHRRWFADQRVGILSPQGRFALEARGIDGKKLLDVTAHGKHLFYHFGNRQVVHIHLGLYGKFRLHQNPAPQPQGAVRLRLVGQQRTFDLNGPNQCELIPVRSVDSIRARLGEDPLRPDADPERVWEKISRSRSPIGSLLLNQSVIAGVGNIYRAEVLFLLGIHPQRTGQSLDRPTFERLWSLLVDLLQIGVKYNRIISVEPGGSKTGLSRLTRDERLLVYKKDYCQRCQAIIQHWELANRTVYACPVCQSP